MSKIFLINVGANSGHQNQARSPLFKNGSFEFVTYPDEGCRTTYPQSVRRFVSNPQELRTHLDPDLNNLTYGDYCKNRRARALLAAETGDILLFWGLFWRMSDEKSIIWSCRDRGWYLMAAIRIKEILESGEGIGRLAEEEQARARQNAHMDGLKVDSRELVRVFVGDPNHSARFHRAVDFEVYQDGGLMQSIVRTADGSPVKWYESPRWNSVTRSCRAILDLSKTEDRKSANVLERHIHDVNPEFSLLAGLI